MRQVMVTALIALLSLHVAAIDLGALGSKLFDIGKKVVDANSQISEQQEIAIGDGLAQRILGASPLVNDPALQHYVNDVGRWLASQTERPDLPWTFGVIDTETVNAFSMPGGYVLITRGLFERMHSESELAGVLGHEISHVLRKHHLKAIQQAMGRGALAEALQYAADQKGTNASEFAAKFAQAGLNVYAHGLDKSDEFEADRLGVVIAARGGYSPYGLAAVLQTLGDNPQDGELKLLFDTHPLPADRLDRLGAAMGSRFDDLPAKIDDEPRFAQIKATLASLPPGSP